MSAVPGVAAFAALFDASNKWTPTDTIQTAEGAVRFRTFRHVNSALRLFVRTYPDRVLWISMKSPGFKGKQPPWEYAMGDYTMVTVTLDDTTEHLRTSERWTKK